MYVYRKTFIWSHRWTIWYVCRTEQNIKFTPITGHFYISTFDCHEISIKVYQRFKYVENVLWSIYLCECMTTDPSGIHQGSYSEISFLARDSLLQTLIEFCLIKDKDSFSILVGLLPYEAYLVFTAFWLPRDQYQSISEV